MKFENIRVYNFENALKGMRNPLASWKKIDSEFGVRPRVEVPEGAVITHEYENGLCEYAKIGPNDMGLAKRLIAGGSEHRKFLRQIFVTVDITAPLYYFKEFDTYRIGVTENSTSTMHKLASTPITLDCFELGDYSPELDMIDDVPLGLRVDSFIDDLEQMRQKYLMTNDKRYWKELVRWLPNGWLQTRTVTMNYENLLSMYHQRRNHKLTEWSIDFINFIKSLPYASDFLIPDEAE
jgi:hypothetical protein